MNVTKGYTVKGDAGSVPILGVEIVGTAPVGVNVNQKRDHLIPPLSNARLLIFLSKLKYNDYFHI